MWWWIVIGVTLVLGLLLLIFSAFVVGAREDERMERWMEEQRERDDS